MVVCNYFISLKLVSWEKSLANLALLQNRLLKAFSVSDFRKCLFLQKLILKSDFARLISIRQVTQLSALKKIPGVDGKISLTFTERFELNELLRLNYNNWYPSLVKQTSVLSKDGNFRTLKLPVVSDRVWHLLVKYSLEPVYEYYFHPHNFGFRVSYDIFDLQKFIQLNFSSSSSINQKRVLIINLERVFEDFNIDLILGNLIAPRGIKLGLFRSLNNGFGLYFPSQMDEVLSLNSLLANIVLNGINDVHSSARFGYSIIFFLKPFANEKVVFNKLIAFLNLMKLNIDVSVGGPFSLLNGFDFLDWNYISLDGKNLSISPNFDNYQKFLFRVKRVLNNSNYGSTVKAQKLFPIVRDWKCYNKFCSETNSRFSLFYLKKRAFKIFNAESKQDLYSVKRLLKKSFVNDSKFIESFSRENTNNALYSGHFIFNYIVNVDIYNSHLHYQPCCFHCGMKCFA